MKNKEMFKDQIFQIACEGSSIALNSDLNELWSCDNLPCELCAFNVGKKQDCRPEIIKWLNSEYSEDCEFEKGELVEVLSRAGKGENWTLRYFHHKRGNAYFYSTSKDVDEQTYCFSSCHKENIFKYGTLGGLTKLADLMREEVE